MAELSRKLVILTALKEECAAVQAAFGEPDSRVEIVRCGMGWENAARAAQAALDSGAGVLCFSGFCGALKAGLAVGDVVLSETLLGPSLDRNEFESHKQTVEALKRALAKSGLRFHAGRTVTLRGAVLRSAEKLRLGVERGALAVDMESYAVAETAGARIPVFSLRAVSDSVDDELPEEVLGFLNEQGNPNLGRITRYALRHPRNIRTLLQLRTRATTAGAALTQAWRAAAPEIFKLLE